MMNAEEMTESDTERIQLAWQKLEAIILLDLCAEENIVFGRIGRGEKIPFESYVPAMGLDGVAPYVRLEELKARYIDKGFIAYDDIEKVYYEIYGSKVSNIFQGVPLLKQFDYDDAIVHYDCGLYEYLKDLYGMFREIITTEINPEPFAVMPDILDREEPRNYYFKISKFIKSIKVKKLKQGACINRYLKDTVYLADRHEADSKTKRSLFFEE